MKKKLDIYEDEKKPERKHNFFDVVRSVFSSVFFGAILTVCYIIGVIAICLFLFPCDCICGTTSGGIVDWVTNHFLLFLDPNAESGRSFCELMPVNLFFCGTAVVAVILFAIDLFSFRSNNRALDAKAAADKHEDTDNAVKAFSAKVRILLLDRDLYSVFLKEKCNSSLTDLNSKISSIDDGLQKIASLDSSVSSVMDDYNSYLSKTELLLK